MFVSDIIPFVITYEAEPSFLMIEPITSLVRMYFSKKVSTRGVFETSERVNFSPLGKFKTKVLFL